MVGRVGVRRTPLSLREVRYAKSSTAGGPRISVDQVALGKWRVNIRRVYAVRR